MREAGLDPLAFQIRPYYEKVTYPGGSYDLNLVKVTTPGGTEQAFMSNLIPLDPRVAVREIQAMLRISG
jgi:hypothetical protein